MRLQHGNLVFKIAFGSLTHNKYYTHGSGCSYWNHYSGFSLREGTRQQNCRDKGCNVSFWVSKQTCLFVWPFCFDLLSDWQQRCNLSVKNFHITFIQIPQTLASPASTWLFPFSLPFLNYFRRGCRYEAPFISKDFSKKGTFSYISWYNPLNREINTGASMASPAGVSQSSPLVPGMC